MATFNKTLQGVIRIEEEGTYFFSLPTNPTIIPNALSNQVIEEVYIVVSTPLIDVVAIILPAISTFNNSWNTKIYVVNGQDKTLVSIPKILPEETPDAINFTIGAIQIPENSIGYLHIVDTHNWALWLTP